MRQIQSRLLWGISENKAIFLGRLTICEFAYFNNTFTYTFINTMTNTDTNKRFIWNRLLCAMSQRQNKAILLIRQSICQCWFSVFFFVFLYFLSFSPSFSFIVHLGSVSADWLSVNLTITFNTMDHLSVNADFENGQIWFSKRISQTYWWDFAKKNTIRDGGSTVL